MYTSYNLHTMCLLESPSWNTGLCHDIDVVLYVYNKDSPFFTDLSDSCYIQSVMKIYLNGVCICIKKKKSVDDRINVNTYSLTLKYDLKPLYI